MSNYKRTDRFPSSMEPPHDQIDVDTLQPLSSSLKLTTGSSQQASEEEDAATNSKTADAEKTPSTTSTSCWNRLGLDAMQLEAVLRIGLAALLGFILSIGRFPNAVPPDFANVVGCAAVPLVVSFPKLVFSIGAMMPLVVIMFVVVLLTATVLLAAATVSDAFMTVVYSVLALFYTGFYFGKASDKMWSFAAPLIALSGMMTTSFRPLVQGGISVSHNVTLDTNSATEMTRMVLTALCVAQQGVLPLEDCQVESLYGQATGHLPEDLGNALAGQPIAVAVNNGTLTAQIPGGMWLVTAFWTEQGLENPLAVWRNILIAICWAMIAIMAAVVLPFPRTIRALLSETAVPVAISKVLKILGGDRETAENIGPVWAVMSGGDKAKMTNFEPRLCRAPFANIEPQLQDLMLQVDHTILLSILALSASDSEQVAASKSTRKIEADMVQAMASVEVDKLEQSKGLLAASARALASGATEDAEELAKLRKEEADAETASNDAHSSVIKRHCALVAGATIDWLHALDYKNTPKLSPKEKRTNLKKMYTPWVLSATSPAWKTLETFSILFRPKSWSLMSFLWCAELAGGYIALFCMVVYWPAFADFRISHSDIAIGGVFNGWTLCGYAFAWQLTTEGTIKKSIERLVGTCVGGFLAWLGVIVASWSYDDLDPINPYGFVTWLTAFSAILSWFGIDKGFKAFMGADYSHGTSAMYGVMTLTIIGLDVWAVEGSKSDLVVNRIVATVTGVLMAMVIAAIPPYLKGGDPVHSREYLLSLKDAVTRFERDVADESIDVDAKSLSDVYLKEATKKRVHAKMLLKDAGKLKRLKIKILKPNDKLMPLLNDMVMTEALLGNLIDYCKFMKEHFEEDWSLICRAAKEICEKGKYSVSDSVESGDRVKLARFISWAHSLHVRLGKHQAALDELS